MAVGAGGVKKGAVSEFAAIGAAILVMAIGLFSPLGFWSVALIFPIPLFGLVLLIIALFQGRRWWLLLLLPIFVVPLSYFAQFAYECTRGPCL